jgi:hypothetical protein
MALNFCACLLALQLICILDNAFECSRLLRAAFACRLYTGHGGSTFILFIAFGFFFLSCFIRVLHFRHGLVTFHFRVSSSSRLRISGLVRYIHRLPLFLLLQLVFLFSVSSSLLSSCCWSAVLFLFLPLLYEHPGVRRIQLRFLLFLLLVGAALLGHFAISAGFDYLGQISRRIDYSMKAKQSLNDSTLISERVVQGSKTGQGSPVEIPQGAKNTAVERNRGKECSLPLN